MTILQFPFLFKNQTEATNWLIILFGLQEKNLHHKKNMGKLLELIIIKP
uniref:Uncharacterized protein n=1 Tax=Anguilla anguilla TaxID=7936 RepID=A0A0E9P7G8_ANGAN